MSDIVHIERRPGIDSLPEWAGELHPVLARVYASRAVRSGTELDGSLARLLPFEGLYDIDRAVDLLVEALEGQWRILIVGDFDADGATSSALAVRALRELGAAEVDFLVPNRFEYGYGLTPEIVAVATAANGAPAQLLITVDNGISSVAGVAAAREAGMRVLVTDHHLAGSQLPDADAIVNPNRPEDGFASKALAGVGVIFYVLMALRVHLRERGWFERRGLGEPNLARHLDLVALGTVADVVPLDANNRILVAQGLARIRAGQACPGIQALLEVGGRDPAMTVAADLGFAVGPRLNAAGRLEDMSVGIACLLSDDVGEARALAARLDGLNRERRAIEDDMKARALAHIEEVLEAEEGELPVGLCLYDADWHEGVVGLLASRIKDRLHRPVIAFAPGGGSDQLKGSARSVSGLHIRDALDAVATRHPALLSKFGGHAMAAGLTIRREDFDAFARAFDAEVRRHLDPAALRGAVLSDGALGPADHSLDLAEALRFAGPWGQGFPEPVFDGVFDLIQRRIVGERHLKLVVRHPEGGPPLDAIAFNVTDADWPAAVSRVRLAYRLDVNSFRGQRSVQLVVVHLELV